LSYSPRLFNLSKLLWVLPAGWVRMEADVYPKWPFCARG